MKYAARQLKFIITSSTIIVFVFFVSSIMLHSQTIRAQSFELIDATGNTTANLTNDADGTVRLSLGNQLNHSSITLSVDPSGTASLKINQPNESGVRLTTIPNTGTFLTVHEQGKLKISVGSFDSESGQLNVYSSESIPLLSITGTSNGALIALRNQAGKDQILLTTKNDEAAVLLLSNQPNQQPSTWLLAGSSFSGLLINDDQGKVTESLTYTPR